jgi:hypothetical protein
MHIKTLSILAVSGLIAGAAISNADAAAIRPAQPQSQASEMDSWLAANGRMAIRQQSDDNHSHHHGADLGAHGAEAGGSSHSGGSHGGGGRR